MNCLLDTNRVTIKISSRVPLKFNVVKMQVLTVDGKDWCRAKEICKSLEYEKRTNDAVRAHCSGENSAHKYQLIGHSTAGCSVNWPSDSQKYNLYISEESLYEMVFSSQQPLGKTFRKHCCKKRNVSINSTVDDKQSHRGKGISTSSTQPP